MTERKEMTLQEIQKGSYQVLIKIKQICDAENIRYYLAYGTLIGAIRHNGFIPWDDDIDVIMPRPDYEKFISYCKSHKEELKPFALKHYTTCKEYIYPIARLIDSRYEIHYNTAKEYGLGLFVDIYPFDGYVPEDKKQFRKLEKNIKKILTLGNKQFIKSKHWYKTLPKFFWWLIIKHQNLNKLIEKTDKLAQKYPYDESEFVDNMNWDFNRKANYRREWFEGQESHVFVHDEFSIPKGYDIFLRTIYGDYMQLPPESERIAHHFYQAYRK